MVQDEGILVSSPQIDSTRWELLCHRMVQTLANGLLEIEAWLMLEVHLSQSDQLYRSRTFQATTKHVTPEGSSPEARERHTSDGRSHCQKRNSNLSSIQSSLDILSLLTMPCPSSSQMRKAPSFHLLGT